MTIINKNKQIQPDRADLVPDLKEFNFYQGEMEKLKKLCSLILQEEEKVASDKKYSSLIIIFPSFTSMSNNSVPGYALK